MALWYKQGRRMRIVEVGVGFDVVELGALDHRDDGCPGAGAAAGAGEQMIVPAKRDLGVLPPVSGGLRWFTIAGIHCLGSGFADLIVSAAHRATWLTSRWSRALSWSCLAGCPIR